MKMNLPNKLTVLRVLMIPFFVLFMSVSQRYSPAPDGGPREGYILFRMIAEVIFVLASFTDFLDGYIARKYQLVTDFGKFMDPLADKVLTCSAFILFVAEGSLKAWVLIIIIAREFIISGFRLVASDRGIVIAASWWGKVKTVFQMLLCILLILPWTDAGSIFMLALTWAVIILTVASLVDYIAKNVSVITEGGM